MFLDFEQSQASGALSSADGAPPAVQQPGQLALAPAPAAGKEEEAAMNKVSATHAAWDRTVNVKDLTVNSFETRVCQNI